jgi:hypothetical protein
VQRHDDLDGDLREIGRDQEAERPADVAVDRGPKPLRETAMLLRPLPCEAVEEEIESLVEPLAENPEFLIAVEKVDDEVIAQALLALFVEDAEIVAERRALRPRPAPTDPPTSKRRPPDSMSARPDLLIDPSKLSTSRNGCASSCRSSRPAKLSNCGSRSFGSRASLSMIVRARARAFICPACSPVS